MSIYKINSGLSTTQKLELLNNMILELEGMVSQGKFDKNELDVLYTQLYQRKYLRGQLLGNTLATYTGWSHVSAQTGYSIWKYVPTTYAHDLFNSIYFDDKILDFRGPAFSESLTAFKKVFLYNGATYTDDTTEAGTENGTEFSLISGLTHYLYIGSDSYFSGINFNFHTRGLNYTLKVEYYTTTWVELTANTNQLVDTTSNFVSNGMISYTTPAGWATNTVNSVAAYWIRISTTTTPTTVAKAYVVAPNSSVISLLSLSSTQISNEEWAWCDFNNTIYVTIRNAGVAAYEGSSYIASGSSTTNLQNYFIYNHEYKADYQLSTYISSLCLAAPNAAPADAVLANGQVAIWIDSASNKLAFKVKYSTGVVKSGTINIS